MFNYDELEGQDGVRAFSEVFLFCLDLYIDFLCDFFSALFDALAGHLPVLEVFDFYDIEAKSLLVLCFNELEPYMIKKPFSLTSFFNRYR